MIEPGTAFEHALAALECFGVLLFSDPALPSLTGIIVGEPIRGSWWGHPRGNVIYHTMNVLEDAPDVLSTKLIAGKVTYVHRRLWPSILVVGTAREPWQMDTLSDAARWLLEITDANGEVGTNDLPSPAPTLSVTRKRVPDLARELERRLLVHATEIHTSSGRHAKVLQSWGCWADRVEVVLGSVQATDGRRALEAAADRLASEVSGGVARLPWR